MDFRIATFEQAQYTLALLFQGVLLNTVVRAFAQNKRIHDTR